MSVDHFARIRTLLDQGKLEEAKTLVDRAVQHHLSDSASKRRIGSCAAHLAHLLAAQNRLSDAIDNLSLARRLYADAEASKSKATDDDDDDEKLPADAEDELTLCLYALGTMHQRANDHAQARRAFRDALARADALGRRETAQAVAILSGLAVCDQLEERALDAAKGFDKAIALQLKIGGTRADADRALAELLHSCGAAYFHAVATRDRGRLDERVSACARLERALQIRERLGDAKQAAELHLLLGTYLTAMGDDAAGDERLTRGTDQMLAVAKNGKESGEYASCLEARATALQMRGRHHDALAAFDSAYAIYERALKGKKDTAPLVNCARKLLVSLDRVADDLRSKKKPKEAMALYERALPLRAATSGDDSEAVAGTHVLIGTLAFETSDVDGAKRHFDTAMRLFSLGGAESEPVGGMLFNLGNVERSRGNFAEATRLYERAKAIFAKLKQTDKVQYLERVLASAAAPAAAPEPSQQPTDWKPFLLLTVLLTAYFAYRFN